MNFLSFSRDEGNVLIEAVGFVTLAAGLILLGGLQLFEAQQTVLELSSLARNTMRSVQLDADLDWHSALSLQQQQVGFFSDKKVELEVSCISECTSKSKLLALELRLEGYSVQSFGVVDD